MKMAAIFPQTNDLTRGTFIVLVDYTDANDGNSSVIQIEGAAMTAPTVSFAAGSPDEVKLTFTDSIWGIVASQAIVVDADGATGTALVSPLIGTATLASNVVTLPTTITTTADGDTVHWTIQVSAYIATAT